MPNTPPTSGTPQSDAPPAQAASRAPDPLLTGLPKRYTVEREIGRGGASIVYLAREQRPDRLVVIKVLDPRACRGLDRERFLREVEIASTLRHPGIVPIFAAGEAACGDPSCTQCLYYVMPYVPGESLRGRMTREGQMPITTTVAIARDVAEALDHAHRHGFVHRDVKPENVLLDESHAFVTDFGIARTIEKDGITLEGRTVGTPHYMSPEQVADQALTGSTDIYSLACMVYEMLAGVVPFGGATPAIVMRRQVEDPPPPLAPLRPDLPRAVDRVLGRALAKRTLDRPASAREFARELARAAALTAMPGADPDPTPATLLRILQTAVRRPLRTALFLAVPLATLATWIGLGEPPRLPAPGPAYTDSVAVLIFRNLTGRPELDVLGQLLADEAHRQLARHPDLRVTSLHSAFAVQHGTLGIRELADTLGVGHLLEGSMRLRADTVLFHYALWDADEIAAVRGDARVALARAPEEADAIARGIVDRILALYPELGPARGPPSAGAGAGWSAYQRGRALLQRRGADDVRHAIAAFDTAVTADPGDAAAHAALSSALGLSLLYQYAAGDDGYRAAASALAHAERALALDPQLAAGYSARGYLASRAWGPLARARHDFAAAQQLEPNAAEAHSWNAILLGLQDRRGAAVAAAEKAVRLDPLSPGPRVALLSEALAARRYDVVIREAGRAQQLAPELVIAREMMALAYLLTAQPARCLRLNLGPYAGIRAICLAAVGHPAEGQRLADSLARGLDAGGFRDPAYGDVLRAGNLAAYYAWRGDAATALVWAGRAFALSPVGIDRRLLQSALFDRVRGDSTFAAGLANITDHVWGKVEKR